MIQCSTCRQSRWTYARYGALADHVEWLTGWAPYGCQACKRHGWTRTSSTPRVIRGLAQAGRRVASNVRVPAPLKYQSWRDALALSRHVPVRMRSFLHTRTGALLASLAWVGIFALGLAIGAVLFSSEPDDRTVGASVNVPSGSTTTARASQTAPPPSPAAPPISRPGAEPAAAAPMTRAPESGVAQSESSTAAPVAPTSSSAPRAAASVGTTSAVPAAEVSSSLPAPAPSAATSAVTTLASKAVEPPRSAASAPASPRAASTPDVFPAKSGRGTAAAHTPSVSEPLMKPSPAVSSSSTSRRDGGAKAASPAPSSGIAAATAAVVTTTTPSDSRARRDTPAARMAQRGTPAATREAKSQPPVAFTAAASLPKFHGRLSIRSEPQGALVSIDGRIVGATPLQLTTVPAGSRVIRIESQGYERWSSAARVVANRETSVVATLQRAAGQQ